MVKGKLHSKFHGLTPEHYKALEMKFKGATYKQIAEAVGKSQITIKVWFRKGGKLHKAYKEFQAAELNRIRNGALEVLRSGSTKAAQTLVELLDSLNENIRIKAAIEILDRLGIKVEIGSSELSRKYGGTTIVVTRGEYGKDDKRKTANIVQEKIEVREGGSKKYVGKLPTLAVNNKKEKIKIEKLK